MVLFIIALFPDYLLQTVTYDHTEYRGDGVPKSEIFITHTA